MLKMSLIGYNTSIPRRIVSRGIHTNRDAYFRVSICVIRCFYVSVHSHIHTHTSAQELSARGHPSQNAVAVSRYALTRTSPTDQYLADVQLCTGPSMLTSNFPNTAIICVIIIALLPLSPSDSMARPSLSPRFLVSLLLYRRLVPPSYVNWTRPCYGLIVATLNYGPCTGAVSSSKLSFELFPRDRAPITDPGALFPHHFQINWRTYCFSFLAIRWISC